jgi:hypothetical protein
MTLARFITGIIIGEHCYIFRYDSSERSLFGVFSKVQEFRLDGTFTREQALRVREAVCREVSLLFQS